MNYNIEAGHLTLARDFLRRGVDLVGFANYDGGGFNFYIIEFQKRADLEDYCRELTERFPHCWIEHDDKQHEDISSEMSRFVFRVAPGIVPERTLDCEEENKEKTRWDEGIQRAILDFENSEFPSCPQCGSGHVVYVLGISGATIQIASGTRKVRLFNFTDAAKGRYFCDSCKAFFSKGGLPVTASRSGEITFQLKVKSTPYGILWGACISKPASGVWPFTWLSLLI